MNWDMFHVDHALMRRLDDEARMYGLRPLLDTLVKVCETRAKRSVELFNTVQAKQWAAWAVALEALRDDRKLTDPGRE